MKFVKPMIPCSTAIHSDPLKHIHPLIHVHPYLCRGRLLIIAVHQLASMDLPKVFQLQALKLQDLHQPNQDAVTMPWMPPVSIQLKGVSILTEVLDMCQKIQVQT